MRPTRAMVLAAGLGTRLRPLTDAVPKPMLPVRGKPLLEHHVEALAAAGVREIVINLHHFPGVIVDHFGDGRRWAVRITYSHEPELLGTAGAVKRVAHLFPEPFFVLYGDNYLRCALVALAGLHERAGAVASLALVLLAASCRTPDASTYTLYRGSVTDASMRVHVATFDAADGERYNQSNCDIARALFQDQPGVTVRYSCEKGRYRR